MVKKRLVAKSGERRYGKSVRPDRFVDETMRHEAVDGVCCSAYPSSTGQNHVATNCIVKFAVWSFFTVIRGYC